MNDDISSTIAPKSDQLNADDLLGGPIDIVVTGGTVKEDPQQPVSIRFEGDNGKPYKPCKSMRRVLFAAWGKSIGGYEGKAMRLFCDPNVTFGGAKVGGIRISHMSHLDGPLTIPLTASKAVRKPYTVKPMDAPQTQSAEADPFAVVQAITTATNAAQGGTAAFMAWYNSDEGKEVRHLFKDDADEMAKIKAECAKADAALTETETEGRDL